MLKTRARSPNVGLLHDDTRYNIDKDNRKPPTRTAENHLQPAHPHRQQHTASRETTQSSTASRGRKHGRHATGDKPHKHHNTPEKGNGQARKNAKQHGEAGAQSTASKAPGNKPHNPTHPGKRMADRAVARSLKNYLDPPSTELQIHATA